MTSAEKGAFFTLEDFAAGDESSPGGLLAAALAKPISKTSISPATANLTPMLPSIRPVSLANLSCCHWAPDSAANATADTTQFGFRTKGIDARAEIMIDSLGRWKDSAIFYSVLGSAVMQL